MRLPVPRETINAIDRKLEAKKQRPSYHMPASNIAEECDRCLWLNFRWVVAEHFDGRMLRLFDRGKREEASIVKYLKSIGVNIVETGVHQREIHCGPWVKGFCDGIVKNGLPESPKRECIAEFKTSNDRGFKELVAHGVKAAKPKHYGQMQAYMKATGLERCFYWCVNKNSDEIYTEWVYYDEQYATLAVDRANNIAMHHRMPKEMTSFNCKFCKNYEFCNGHDVEIPRHCRTCEWSLFGLDGKVRCQRTGRELTANAQLKGCKEYQIHQDLMKDKDKWWKSRAQL